MMVHRVVAFGDHGIHADIVRLRVNGRHVPELMTNTHGSRPWLHRRERPIVVPAAIAQPMKIPVESEHGDEEQRRLHRAPAARPRNRPRSIFDHPHIRPPRPERQAASGLLDDRKAHLDSLFQPPARERSQVDLPW